MGTALVVAKSSNRGYFYVRKLALSITLFVSLVLVLVLVFVLVLVLVLVLVFKRVFPCVALAVLELTL